MGHLTEHYPMVSLIVPCRNNAKTITQTLTALLALDYPAARSEIIIVDGMSADGTRELIEKFKGNADREIRLFDNPRRIAPCAFNRGIECARGELIVLINAHTIVEPTYLKEAVKALVASGAAVAGGPVRPLGRNYVSNAISRAVTCHFGLGGAAFRNPSLNGYVSSVYMGIYRRKIFQEVGKFDEELVRGQDHELHCRICKASGKIYMSPGIKSYYYCRDSLRALAIQMFRTGMWNVKKVKCNPDAFALRHWVPFGFVTTLIALAVLSLIWNPFLFIGGAILSLYVAVNLIVSSLQAAKRGVKYLPLLPLIFAIMHFCYGFGTVFGLFRFRFPVRALVKGVWHSGLRPGS